MKLPILLLVLLWQPSLHAVSVTIGTGGEQGIYYQVIKEFCRLAHKSDPTVQCKPQASSGSIENLRLLQAGEIPYALVQSDWLYQASQGTGPFARQPQPELRTLFATHAEPFTIVMRADGDITTLEQLKLAPIDMGLKNSGTRQTALALFSVLGAKEQDLDLKSVANLSEALCSKQIDAYGLVMGHPNRIVLETSKRCEALCHPFHVRRGRNPGAIVARRQILSAQSDTGPHLSRQSESHPHLCHRRHSGDQCHHAG